MKQIGIEITIFYDFSSLRRKVLPCALSLLLAVYASGLRMHACHLHEMCEMTCPECSVFCALLTNQHACCTDANYCEHEHTHSVLIVSNTAPLLTNTANNFQKHVNIQSSTPFSPHDFDLDLFSNIFLVAAGYPRTGSGRPCPITGQQLPLLI